jgi:uncharacterized SAM-binding protein YcdF (DUF218 family)
MTEEALAYAETIWKFMQTGHTPVAADLMLVFGTNDLRVATVAAEFYREGLAPLVLITGGIAHHGDLLATPWDRPEAVIFAEEMIRCGVPEDRILIEPFATNTAENVRFARALIEALPGPPPRNATAVVKPFMQRRVLATMAVYWPELPHTLAHGTPRSRATARLTYLLAKYSISCWATYSASGFTPNVDGLRPSRFRTQCAWLSTGWSNWATGTT